MHPLTERVVTLSRSLEELEQQILDEQPPRDVLDELKTAIDHMRTAVWAAVTHDQSGGVRRLVAHTRCSRITEMLHRLEWDVEAGDLAPGSQAYQLVAHSVRRAAKEFLAG